MTNPGTHLNATPGIKNQPKGIRLPQRLAVLVEAL